MFAVYELTSFELIVGGIVMYVIGFMSMLGWYLTYTYKPEIQKLIRKLDDYFAGKDFEEEP